MIELNHTTGTRRRSTAATAPPHSAPTITLQSGWIRPTAPATVCSTPPGNPPVGIHRGIHLLRCLPTATPMRAWMAAPAGMAASQISMIDPPSSPIHGRRTRRSPSARRVRRHWVLFLQIGQHSAGTSSNSGGTY